MKLVTTLLLLLVGLTAFAQRSTYHQNITDDGKKLVIRIDQHKNGKEFHYSNSYDVRGMTDEERSALVSRVLDSVQFGEKGKTTTIKSTWNESSERTWEEAPKPAVEVASVQRAVPFTKLVEEDTVAQRVKISYQYMRNGEEHSYERTINKQGKSREEIEKLIEETEESIGFSAKNS
jgi:hypothetical protein